MMTVNSMVLGRHEKQLGPGKTLKLSGSLDDIPLTRIGQFERAVFQQDWLLSRQASEMEVVVLFWKKTVEGGRSR